MLYPFNILNADIFPVLGKQVKGLPHYIDLRLVDEMSPEKADEYRNNEVKKAGKEFGIYSNYLENTERCLKSKKQNAEKRIYHLGIDLHIPAGFRVYAPLDAEVVVAEVEEGLHNYGGMIVLKHNENDGVFYSLYGHLAHSDLPKVGIKFKKGDAFGTIGTTAENGSWAPHTHIQVFTENGYKNGWVNKGYCSLNDLSTIDEYSPNPVFLIRF